MNRTMAARLSLMMFLQFIVWGCWYSTIAVYMTQEGMGDLTHWPYTTNAIAAIVSPFFLGFVADRYFSTQKVLGFMHLLGAFFMLIAPTLSGRPTLFLLAVGLHNVCYMPTLALANTLAFHHVRDQEKEFPLIRVFGTFGWIAAGLFISFALSRFAQGIKPEATALPLYTSGITALILGVYCYTMPNTPPQGAGQTTTVRSILGLDALKQLSSRSFYIFLVASLLICIPLTAYYNFLQTFLEAANFELIAATQTLGQFSEIFFMLAMPFFFRRLGVKWMLAAGMLGWVLRYALFALGASDGVTWMILGGILLHGMCFDFFFVTGQIYMDKKATPEIRGQAQGLLTLATYGVGMLIGAQVAGNLHNWIKGPSAALSLPQYQLFWLIPAALAVVILVLFVALFRDKVEETASI